MPPQLQCCATALTAFGKQGPVGDAEGVHFLCDGGVVVNRPAMCGERTIRNNEELVLA